MILCIFVIEHGVLEVAGVVGELECLKGVLVGLKQDVVDVLWLLGPPTMMLHRLGAVHALPSMT